MKQRIDALDSASGFSVLFLPAIHTVLMYSQPYVYKTWFGNMLTFIAEAQEAQIFMTVMGILFTLKKTHKPQTVLKRACILLFTGYALNALKFLVPYSLNALPIKVQQALQLSPGKEIQQLLLIGDILQFAAIALLIIYAVYQLKYYQYWSALFAIANIFISPFLWDIAPGNYLVQLFIGQPPQIFFPVFPWLVYPLIGLSIGHYLQKDEIKTFQYCKIAGISTIVIGLIYSIYDSSTSAAGFYRTYPAQTFLHIGVTLLSLWLWKKITTLISKTPFFTLLQFCSRHVTVIYIFQWILICWLLPFTGYQTMNLIESLMTSLYLTTVVIGLTFLLTKKKQQI